MSVLRMIFGRISVVLPTLIGAALVAFFIIRLAPGDPVELMVGERASSAEQLQSLRHQYGFDQPLWKQFADFAGHAVQGDLGRSIVTNRPVLTEFASLFPATVELGLCAILFAIVLGIPIGCLAAAYRGSTLDYGIVTLSAVGASMPIFWWGLMSIMAFSVMLGWTPVSGRISDVYFIEPVTGFMLIDTLLSDEKGAFGSALAHLILPTVILGTQPLATIVRMSRSSLLEVLGEDYMRTARSFGMSSTRLIFVYALRNALVPIVTVLGLQIGSLCGGAILTETIFAWPGVGRWMVESIQRRDYPVIQGGALLIAGLVVAVNLTVDASYYLLNPRLRRSR